MNAPLAKSRKKDGTACDRCYELKERCARESISVICIRCARLQLNCTSVRPVRRAGRRPRRLQDVTLQSSRQPDQVADIKTWLLQCPELVTSERELLFLLLARPDHLSHYPVSLGSQDGEQRSLATMLMLPTALPALKDVYLAYAEALKLLQSRSVGEEEKSASLRYASSAMKTLCSLHVSSPQDAVICLTLGASLALTVYSVVGVGVADICHYSLSITSPFLNTGEKELDATISSWQSVLVLLETMECLMYRRKPTRRLRFDAMERVDRHLGLCLSLLPSYYDLCEISHSQASTTNSSLDQIRLLTQLLKVNTVFQAWQPSPPRDFMNVFATAEVVNLLAQARIYRLAGLLIGHRLQYKFGEHDNQANIWSNEIILELELARRISKTRIRSVTLPFIAAAVEIQEAGGRVIALEKVDEYVDKFTPVVQKATKTFLLRIWHERDAKITTCWFDSVHKPCAVLEDIETTCFPSSTVNYCQNTGIC